MSICFLRKQADADSVIGSSLGFGNCARIGESQRELNALKLKSTLQSPFWLVDKGESLYWYESIVGFSLQPTPNDIFAQCRNRHDSAIAQTIFHADIAEKHDASTNA